MRSTMIWILSLATIATLLWATPAAAQGARVDVLKELVPPPRMILRAQDELGLTDKQKKQLKEVIKEAQTASLDLEFKVEEEAEKLAKIIGQDNVDIKKALAQADKLMAAESALKRVKLEMMLKTKSILTKEQLQKIEKFREEQKQKRQSRRNWRDRRGPNP